MRTIAIGDVHGELTQLDGLIAAINPTTDDHLIFLGDLIDRGPDSKGVIERVIDLMQVYRVTAILGNHEEMLLDALVNHRIVDPIVSIPYWCKYGGDETIRSYGMNEETYHKEGIPALHLKFIRAMVPFYETPTHVFVHASYTPTTDPAYWTDEVLRWTSYSAIKKEHVSGRIVVCGHMPGTQVRGLCTHYVCIDTGCGLVERGPLTAYCAETGELWESAHGSHPSPPIPRMVARSKVEEPA